MTTRTRPHRPGREPARRAAPETLAERIERRLARRVRAWAETWRQCPRNACRRHGACRDEDDCRGVERTSGPVIFTPEAQRDIRAALDRASGRAPLYDPEPEAE